MTDSALTALRAQILDLVGEYCAATFPARDFIPGSTKVPVSGKVFDAAEMRSLVDSALDFWLTTGRFAEQFEREFARWSGLRDCLRVMSVDPARRPAGIVGQPAGRVRIDLAQAGPSPPGSRR